MAVVVTAPTHQTVRGRTTSRSFEVFLLHALGNVDGSVHPCSMGIKND